MKLSKYTLISFVMLVIVAAAYRAIPGRPWGFAPQFAMAIFGGAVISDKKLAFLLPLASLFISDLFYELLYSYGLFEIKGFYSGMLENYILFGALTVIGFFVKADQLASVAKGAFAAPTVFFFVSNFMTWAGNGGYQRPKTWTGLAQSYMDGVPFYANSLMATAVFGALLFGGYQLVSRWMARHQYS